MSKAFPFPRTRSLLLRLLNAIFPPEQPNAQQLDGYINAQVAEKTQSSGSLSPVASAWVAPTPPTVAQLSPASPQRARMLSARQVALARGFHAEQQRYQAGLAQSVQINRAAFQFKTGHLPTLHTLPSVPRAVLHHIDAQSRETPPQGYNFQHEQDEDATEEMSALRKMEKGRF